jgi:tetratricopeptide (TPR) repeat protein
MPKFGRVAVLPALLSAIVATAAGAQGAAQQCDVDENAGGVAMAVFALSAAQSQGVPQAEQTKQLQTAIGRLFGTDPKKNEADNAKNPVGRAYTLGRIYMMFLSQPDMPVITTRGALGFKLDPTGVANLAVGIDSAFKIVEEKAPQCAPTTAIWRQQAGYVKLVQQAMDFANNNKTDSAQAAAQLALSISSGGPYAHLVLGNVAAQQQKNREAIAFYENALTEAAKDTIYDEVRRTILYTMGNFAVDASAQVDTAKAKADWTFFLDKALESFTALAKDPGTRYSAAANQGKTMVLRAKGDTEAIRNACKAQLDNPSSFDFLTLVQCGVTLAEIKDVANATKLFEAANAQNPNHRDGLYNLALMQINNGEFQKSIATTDKLVSIDPSNPDNLKLYFHAWAGIRKAYVAASDSVGKTANALPAGAASAARKRALVDSAVKLDGLQKAALNTMVEWNTKADSMPHRVVFSEFTPTPDKTTIGGSIENRTDKEQSYTLNVEFLDKEGKVVDTGKATVEKVAPKSTGTFSLTGSKPGIVAFKYAPLTP